MTKFAYFDCLSGISGDMTLGALIDLGVDVQEIESAVRSMGLPEISLTCSETKKCGFRACSVTIEHPPEHAHRHLHHIHEMIDRASEISQPAKDLAKRIFGHVAVAEAKVHGTTLEKVHFHEVGAIDSIADIVGTAVGITSLQIAGAMASPVPTGTGTIKIDHGWVAVPAPATAEILRGIPIAPCHIAKELTTPTGAAILKELCSDFGHLPAMTIDAIGYGAGTMDLPDQPNILRVLLGSKVATKEVGGHAHAHSHHEKVAVVETNLDDTTGEQIADCAARLMDAGALDVTQTPCTMKKGRSGITLSVLARLESVEQIQEILFLHTSTIGVRRHIVDRDVLVRRSVQVQTPLGPVKAKQVQLPRGKDRIKIEYEDAKRVAEEHSLSTDDVRKLAEISFSKA